MNNHPHWRVITVPHHKSRRWYALEWSGCGRTMGKYKYRAVAEMRADELNLGAYAARAKHDPRYAAQREAYSVNGVIAYRYAVRFCGNRIGDAPDITRAWRLAGEHHADLIGISKDNPNRRNNA